MLKGEKTYVFWIGLIILGLASVSLFTIIWFNIITINKYHIGPSLEFQVPFIVAAIVFILIGLYMMKSGVKAEKKEVKL
jgi:hypothetical protein